LRGEVEGTALEFPEVPIERPHERSWLWQADQAERTYLALGVVPVRGVVKNRWVQNQLTRRRPGVERMVQRWGADKFVVPIFKASVGVGPEGEPAWLDPYAAKYKKQAGWAAFPSSLIMYCAREFLESVPESGEHLRPLTSEEAVFGVEGRVAPTDLTRSAGSIGGTKAKHVDAVNKKLLPYLEELVDERWSRAADGGAHRVSKVNSTLKNELRPVAKAAAGETRHISPGAFDEYIVQRRSGTPPIQWYLSLGPNISRFAIGMNAADPRQWGFAFQEGLGSPDVLGAGDLRGQDTHTGGEFQEAVAFIRQGLASKAGYSVEDALREARVVRNSYDVVLFVDGIAVLASMDNPSGKIGTDVDNCIHTWLLLAAAYYMLRPADCSIPFSVAIKALILGDDHVLGAAKGIQQWFTAAAIHAALKPAGVIYTAEDKSLDFGAYWKESERTVFLQRRFVAKDVAGGVMYAAPLEMERVMRVYTSVEEPRNVPNSQFYYGLVNNTLRELVMHSKDLWMEFREALGDEALTFDDGSCMDPRNLPTYEELFAEWVGGSMRTFESGGQWSRNEGAVREVEPTSGEGTFQGLDVGAVTDGPKTTTKIESQAEGNQVASGHVPATQGPVAGRWQDTLMRPLQIEVDTITSTPETFGTGLVNINPLILAAQLPGFARKFAGSRLLTGAKGRVTINTSGTPFHRGALVIAMTPPGQPYRFSAGVSFTPSHLLQMGGAVHNLCGPNETVLEYPLVGLGGSVDLMSATDKTVGMASTPSLVICTLARLSHCSLSTVPSVTMTIRFQVVGGQVTGPTDTYPYAVTAGHGAWGDVFLMANVAVAASIVQVWAPSAAVRAVATIVCATAIQVWLVLGSWSLAGAFVAWAEGWRPRERPRDVEPTAGRGVMKGLPGVTQGGVEESRPGGLVSRPASIAASVFRAASAVPQVATFATTAAAAMDAVGALASAIGFARPPAETPPAAMFLAPDGDLTVGVGQRTARTLARDPKASTAMTRQAGGPAEEDEGSLAWLGQRWALVGSSDASGSSWLTSNNAGTTIMTVPLSPFAIDGGLAGAGLYVAQPPTHVLLGCSHWRGECEFVVQVFAGQLDNGRLRIRYVPESVPTGKLGPSQFYSCVVDLSGSTSCHGKVGWQLPVQVLSVPRDFSVWPVTTYGAGSVTDGYSLGALVVEVDGTLTSGQAVTGVDVKVFMRWPALEGYGRTSAPYQAVRPTCGECGGWSIEVPSVGEAHVEEAQSEVVQHQGALLRQPQLNYVLTGFTKAGGTDTQQ
jgi:hypothetical protein